jgi:hypothetical protein
VPSKTTCKVIYLYKNMVNQLPAFSCIFKSAAKRQKMTVKIIEELTVRNSGKFNCKGQRYQVLAG